MALLIAVLPPATAHRHTEAVSQDPTPASCDGKPMRHHVHRAKALIRAAYALERWRDPTPATAAERRRWQAHRRCVLHEGRRHEITRYRNARRRAHARYRRERLAEIRRRRAVTPFPGPNGTRWAIPWYIVNCESGGNYRARNRVSTAGGAYQIINTTWYAYGGTRYADSHPAAVAPPREQDEVAHRIWQASGPAPWECG